MCLGIPGKVVEINDSGALRMGRVDFGGVRKEACLAYLPEVGIGDYVVVHVGFAISQVDEEEALRTIELLRMLEPEGVEQELEAMTAPEAASSAEPAAGASASLAAAGSSAGLAEAGS